MVGSLLLACSTFAHAADVPAEQPPAPVEDRSFLASPDTFAVCKALDVASTVYLVEHGGHELNPLLKASVNAHHFIPLILLSYGIYRLIVWLNEPKVTTVANVVTCGTAIHNIAQF